MLESMRAAQNTWIGRAVMALIFVLIIVGLSFFGFADLFRRAAGTSVATVGGTDISATAFRETYQNTMQQMQQRLRRPLTNEQARQMGLDQQVLSGLIRDALLDNRVTSLGLATSDPEIAKAITKDPTFAGQNGQFDHDRFVSLLRDNGLTEQTFVRDERERFLRRQLMDGVAGSMTVPAAALDALHRFQSEVRSLDMIVLSPSLVGDGPAPDDAALQAYYDAHKGQFGAPEYRKVVVLAVTPASVATPDTVSIDDVRKAYDAAPESELGAAERRTLQQVVFPTRTEAEAAALRIAAGTSFATIAEERKVSGPDLDLGTVTRAQIFDKAVADAAFSLPANGTSNPIAGSFGTVLVHVVDIKPGDRKPFDAVEPALRRKIAESSARTRDALRTLRDKIEDARSSGKTLAEAAATAGLQIRTIDAIDASGHDKTGALVDLADRDQVLRAVFASDIGVDNDVVQTRTGDQVWFEIAGIDPAHQRSLTDVRPAVEAAWRKDDVAKRLSAKADAVLTQIKDGAALDQVAATVGGVSVTHVGDLKRSGAAGVSQAIAFTAFDTPVGSAGTAAGDDDSRVVFKVLDSVVPPLDADSAESKQVVAQYRTTLTDELLTSYLTQLEGSTGVKVNPAVLRSAIGG